MSPREDITKKSTADSISATFEPQPENTARAGRACCEEYPDRITHHNERPEQRTTPASEEGHAQLTTYDPAGSIPFSEWDGEEGLIPHN